MIRPATLAITATCLAAPAFGQAEYPDCTGGDWLKKSDAGFAADCASMAFSGTLADRQILAWMFFARVNQLIDGPVMQTPETPAPAADAAKEPAKRGISGTDKVPVWMAWPTDPDTFGTARPFVFDSTPRAEMQPSAEKKDLEAGQVSTVDPDGANEEVTRNRISYDYLINSGLTTKLDVAAFFEDNQYVDMPVGSVELKASWLQVTEGSPAPDGAITFQFKGGEYWWRGLHIMVKMQPLSDPGDAFYSENPSWFWTTFEFNKNPGVQHVRDAFIIQPEENLPAEQIDKILTDSGLKGYHFEGYAPNGTQIRFTENGTGETPVILGHTDMEDFAGSPNTAQPRYWTRFEASCHSCHATAAYNPETKAFFPFSVPTGALDPGYNMTDKKGIVQYLGQGYLPLDFMWPIAFQAR